MGHVTFGGGIVSVHGSMGGNTFAAVSGGNVWKSKPIGTRTKTAQQKLVHAAMAQLNQAWNFTLNNAQRQGWVDFAHQQIVISSKGVSHHLSGKNMFCKMNVNVVLAGHAINLIPTTILNVGLPVTLTVSAVSGIGGSLTVECDTENPVAGDGILYGITSPQNPGRKSWGRYIRYIILAFTPNTPHIITSDYIAKFGTLPLVPGQNIGVVAIVLNQTTGVRGGTLKVEVPWT